MLNEITIGSIIHHAEKLDLKDYEPGGKYFMRKEFSADVSSQNLSHIGGIYKIMRPLFKKISAFPAISDQWREAIKTYIVFMDTI